MFLLLFFIVCFYLLLMQSMFSIAKFIEGLFTKPKTKVIYGWEDNPTKFENNTYRTLSNKRHWRTWNPEN